MDPSVQAHLIMLDQFALFVTQEFIKAAVWAAVFFPVLYFTRRAR